MAIFRVTPTDNYTLISNHHLKNRNLSLDAKGLLSQLLAIPEGWDHTLNSLTQFNQEPLFKIQSVMTELEAAGYLTRGIQSGTGKTEFVVHELPSSPTP